MRNIELNEQQVNLLKFELNLLLEQSNNSIISNTERAIMKQILEKLNKE